MFFNHNPYKKEWMEEHALANNGDTRSETTGKSLSWQQLFISKGAVLYVQRGAFIDHRWRSRPGDRERSSQNDGRLVQTMMFITKCLHVSVWTCFNNSWATHLKIPTPPASNISDGFWAMSFLIQRAENARRTFPCATIKTSPVCFPSAGLPMQAA